MVTGVTLDINGEIVSFVRSDLYTAAGPIAPQQLKQLQAMCYRAGLQRTERLELASQLLHREVTSFKDLNWAEAARLVDALWGWEHIGVLIGMRPPGYAPGEREVP